MRKPPSIFTDSNVITGQSQAQGEAGGKLSDSFRRKVCPEIGGFPQF
jgi:hypothetical protein